MDAFQRSHKAFQLSLVESLSKVFEHAFRAKKEAEKEVEKKAEKEVESTTAQMLALRRQD